VKADGSVDVGGGGGAPQPEACAGEQELAEASVRAMLDRDAFSAWLGIRIGEVRPARVTASMIVRDDMTNGFGVAHGGIAFALADSALAFASNTHGRVTVSIENSIRYPAAIHAGDELTAVAEEESATRRLAFFRATVTNQRGDTVALFRGTVYRTGRSLLPDRMADE
jgi:acyl-CoA thioesterase